MLDRIYRAVVEGIACPECDETFWMDDRSPIPLRIGIGTYLAMSVATIDILARDPANISILESTAKAVLAAYGLKCMYHSTGKVLDRDHGKLRY